MRLRVLCILVLVFVLPLLAVTAYADTQMIGTAAPFVVLGAAGVTNTGPSVLTGNLAGSIGTPAITGFPPGTVIGAILPGGAPATVFSDATAAYNFAQGQLGAIPIVGSTLGGLTLTPGVYSLGAAQLTGTLILDAQGNNNAQWTFQIASSLTTASASTVQVINAGSPGAFGGGITWAVTSAATLGTTTTFLGTIIAQAGVVLQTGATIGCGRAISLTASVTLDTNVLSNTCTVSAGTGGGGGTITPPGPLAVPEPGTLALLSSGLAIGLLKRRKLRQVR